MIDRRCFRFFICIVALLLILAAEDQPSVYGGESDTVEASGNGHSNRVYVKIILPIKESDAREHPSVESWIVDELKNRGKTQYRAITNWVQLSEEGEDAVAVWSGTVDGKSWGCPVEGVVRRQTNDIVEADLSGWAPVLLEQSGMSLRNEIGNRRLGVVGQGIAYVAILIVPSDSKTR